MPNPCLLLLLPLLSISLLTSAVDAQTIQRCRTADGTAVYTDRPCEAMDATPMIAPDLPGAPRSDAAGASEVGIPAAADGCPAGDPFTLQRAVERALATRDINALSGLYAWNGAGRGQAAQVLAGMRTLINNRPGNIRLLEADGWVWEPTSAVDGVLPRMHLYRDADSADANGSFQIVRGAGCVWLGG